MDLPSPAQPSLARPALARLSHCLGKFIVVAGLLGATAPAASAATCSPTEVTARGEPASFKWLAVTKARGNWRAKVRALPGLGSAYANFGRSEDQIERCISDQRTTQCTVTARPCRP